MRRQVLEALRSSLVEECSVSDLRCRSVSQPLVCSFQVSAGWFLTHAHQVPGRYILKVQIMKVTFYMTTRIWQVLDGC